MNEGIPIYDDTMQSDEVICHFCKRHLTSKIDDGFRYCVHCRWWVKADGSAIEETREWLKAGDKDGDS